MLLMHLIERRQELKGDYIRLLFLPVKLNTLSLKFPSFVFPIYDRHFYVCEVTCVSRAVVDSQLANA